MTCLSKLLIVFARHREDFGNGHNQFSGQLSGQNCTFVYHFQLNNDQRHWKFSTDFRRKVNRNFVGNFVRGGITLNRRWPWSDQFVWVFAGSGHVESSRTWTYRALVRLSVNDLDERNSLFSGRDWQRNDWFETSDSVSLFLFRKMNQESKLLRSCFESKNQETVGSQ